jgi:hypothetical protein
MLHLSVGVFYAVIVNCLQEEKIAPLNHTCRTQMYVRNILATLSSEAITIRAS